MNAFRSLSTKILLAILVFFILAGCSPARTSASQPTTAIDEIRKSLELPASPVEFVENTTMGNSPDGRWEVTNYRDQEGRVYSVDPRTERVVEIDARALLPAISPAAPSLSEEQIKVKAISFAKAVVPGFDALQPSLQYEEGGKVDNYFFTWYGETSSGSMNRTFLQFGFHKSGVLFAYYNTLPVEE